MSGFSDFNESQMRSFVFDESSLSPFPKKTPTPQFQTPDQNKFNGSRDSLANNMESPGLQAFRRSQENEAAAVQSIGTSLGPLTPAKENAPPHNADDKRATRYDFLDYGNYINRILSTQLLPLSDLNGNPNNKSEINWNFPRTDDKVQIVNVVLSLIENRGVYQSLLQQARDSIEELRREMHDNELKKKSFESQNKQLKQELQQIHSKYTSVGNELKTSTKQYKERIKKLTKECDDLRYRDKQMEHEMRKSEKLSRNLQERVKTLLSARDKRSEKCLGMKLLNESHHSSTVGSVFSSAVGKDGKKGKRGSGSSMNSGAMSSRSSTSLSFDRKKQEQMIESQQQLSEENSMLQSQTAHLQKQLQTVSEENSQLRRSLLQLEVSCKEALVKVNDLFGDCGDATLASECSRINQFKYSMPFATANGLIRNDVQSSARELSRATDEMQQLSLQMRMDKQQKMNDNSVANSQLAGEVDRLQRKIAALEESNKEYENLVRTYINQ